MTPDGDAAGPKNPYLDKGYVSRQLQKGTVEFGTEVLAAIAIPLMIMAEGETLDRFDFPTEVFSDVETTEGKILAPFNHTRCLMTCISWTDNLDIAVEGSIQVS